MENGNERGFDPGVGIDAPGIVINGRFEPIEPPSILAFIWGGKVRPVPSLPFGQATA
jgi:hypothetical protein